MTVIISQPKLNGGLPCLSLSQETLFNTLPILVNIQYVTLDFVTYRAQLHFAPLQLSSADSGDGSRCKHIVECLPS